MARIAGVDLPREKRVEIGLTYIYGIGRATAKRIVEEAGIAESTRVRDLTDSEVNKLREIIDASVMVEEEVYLLEVKRLRRMQGLEKALVELLQIRRNSLKRRI